MSATVIIGGTAGLGRLIAQRYAGAGQNVVIAGRDGDRAQQVAAEIGDRVSGLALDVTQPKTIAEALSSVGEVDALVITAGHLVTNTLGDFDLDNAIAAATAKQVGFPEIVRVLSDRFTAQAAVVLFGGIAMHRPYPGSTMVSTANSSLIGLARTLAAEVAPHRVNVIHPGLIGDSPRWAEADLSHVTSRTPIGRTVTMDEVADAVDFLLRNGGMNALELIIDGGYRARCGSGRPPERTRGARSLGDRAPVSRVSSSVAPGRS